MKKWLYCLCITLIVINYGCQHLPPQTDWEKMNLKGGVRLLKQTIYRADTTSGEIRKGKIIRPEEWSFNAEGFLLTSQTYFTKGALKEIRKHFYNDKGQIIKRIGLYPDSTLKYKLRFNYDDLHQQSELSYYDADNHLISRTTYKYNSKGENTDEYYYKGHDSLIYHKVYFYKNARKFKEKTFHSEGTLGHFTIFKYNKNGQEREVDYFHPDGSLNIKIKYGYNPHGNINFEAMYRSNDSLIVPAWTFKYKYDKRGNWRKKIRFQGGQATDIYFREIKYFNR